MTTLTNLLSFLNNQASQSPKLFSFKLSYSKLDEPKVTVLSSCARERLLQARSYWLRDAIDDEIQQEPALQYNHFWTRHWVPFHGQNGVAVSTGPVVEELT